MFKVQVGFTEDKYTMRTGALITVNTKLFDDLDRLNLMKKDELSFPNYLSSAGCKWQSSQCSSIRLALLTLHDSAQVPVPLANSQ